MIIFALQFGQKCFQYSVYVVRQWMSQAGEGYGGETDAAKSKVRF